MLSTIMEPLTYLEDPDTRVFKTNQGGGLSGFVNGYFGYKVFCQEKRNYLA
jgi:hypothetical protein